VLLTATLPDRAELLRRALESVLKQSVLPDHAVLVSDAARATDVAPLTFAHPAVGLHCLVNQSAPGAANTWNVGIRYVARHWPDCYIAMLDDDDEWDSDHLATCSMQAHRASWPDAVISGLRMVQNGVEHYRPPVHRVTEKEFLVGNPGWQGSNTFIRCSTVVSAGAFTPGLQSCNDRDLAIRVLALPWSTDRLHLPPYSHLASRQLTNFFVSQEQPKKAGWTGFLLYTARTPDDCRH